MAFRLPSCNSAEQVSDPYLQSVLRNSAEVREQAFEMLELLSKLHQAPDDADARVELSRRQKLVESFVAQLRGQNRRVAHLARETKAATGNSRAEVDKLHLQLQNLYYEQRHLLGEISACENYDHSYMRLPMIPLEEFFERYPVWRESGQVNEDGEGEGEQELMKARISEEQRERLSLEEQRLGLVKRKVELMKENQKRKDELSQLDKDLEKFIEAAQPIQKLFEKDY